MKIRLVVLFSFFIWGGVFGQIGFEEHVVIDETNTTDFVRSVYGADLDGDGDNDLLIASLSGVSGQVSWSRNETGQGDFSSQILITNVAQGANSVYAEDLDGDGDLDVIAASTFVDKVEWYENTDGLGNFGDPQVVTTNADMVYNVYAADIDGDGDIDILSVSRDDNKVAWYENTDGLGNFSSEKIISTDVSEATSIGVEDIDNDGDLDVIVGASGVNNLVWYENLDGLGNFGNEEIINSNGFTVHSLRGVDFDGDNDIDILSGSENGILSWYENLDGLGDFGTAQIVTSGEVQINSVDAKDIDNDGDIDIISSSYFYDKLEWYENIDGLGNFELVQEVTSTADGIISIYAIDLDNDLDLDLVSASGNDDRVTWYKNLDGLGNFGMQQDIVSITFDFAAAIAKDLDGDNDLDILATSLNDDKVLWYENLDGLGNFSSYKLVPTNSFGGSSIDAADIDNDGDMDVLCAFSYSGEIVWCENLDGLGDFNSEEEITGDAEGVNFMIATDLDNDGDQDILFSAVELINGGSKVAWIENTDGQGNFDSPQIITTEADGASSVFAADLDGDGDLDVMASSENDDQVTWYENMDGQGSFGAQNIISNFESEAQSVYAADIDNDGDMDVCIGSKFAVTWHENLDGLGNFGSSQTITSDVSNTSSIFASDLDNDNDLDILSSSWGDGKIAWYENLDGQGDFGSQQIISTDVNIPNFVFATDIDNDSDIDVLSASSGDKKIAWYENLGVVANEIIGKIQLDENANGCDNFDPAIPNLFVLSTNGVDSLATFSLMNGGYQLFPNEGEYTTTLTSSVSSYFSIDPISHVNNFVGIGSADTANFCLSSTQTVNDLNIVLFPIFSARPGFNATYQLVYHNVGTTQLNGTTTLEFNDTKLNFLTSSEPTTSQNNNTLTFDFENLNPFETRTIDLTFNVLPPPTVNIDDLLNFTATINPIAGDFTEDDNTFTFDQTVIGSYDPNDIRVLEGEEVLIADADKYLHYIIRFQNTGTASAINVRVENILDDKLDWNTIQLESYSHPNRVEIIDGNEVSFIFDGIYLPDSTTNEPESNGFIAYKIKPKSDIAIGDIISSTADIYFDFNEAVVTNTAMTEIVDPTSIDENTQLRFSIFPIPTSGILAIQSKSSIAEIEIYDQLGQLVLIKSNANQIDLSNLNRGFYFCKVRDVNGDTGIKKVVKE
ncbi:MAG: T9SS type A sorting domain-containing protein [Saprospiraceae bacterium]